MLTSERPEIAAIVNWLLDKRVFAEVTLFGVKRVYRVANVVSRAIVPWYSAAR